MTITIIGKNSFLAQRLAEWQGTLDWCFLSHQEALEKQDWVAGASVVFNLAWDKALSDTPYQAEHDTDSKLAELVAPHKAHYVMASSRKVYGSASKDLMLREDMPPAPEDHYGHYKWQVEKNLAETLPAERLTILRMGNIFGFEYGRRSFLGLALTALKDEGRMHFDIAPDSKRDFLPAPFWCAMIVQILTAPKSGLYNIGSGIGITTDELATTLLETYGQGRADYTSFSYDGQFILDMDKAHATYALECPQKNDIRLSLQVLGRKLKTYQPSRKP